MKVLIDTLLIVLPVFLVIGLGFGIRFTTLVDKEFLQKINKLVYFVALPALLFHKISAADFSATFNPALLFGLTVSTLLVFGITYLYAAMRNYSPQMRGAFCQGAFRGNVAYVGLAISFNAYGEEGFAIAGVLIGFIIPLINFLSVLAMLLPQQKTSHRIGASFWAYQFLFNPLIISSFVGIAWSYLALPIPQVLDRSLDILTGMSLPLALIAIGASFSIKSLQGEFTAALLVSGVKLVAAPALSALLLVFLGVRGVELGSGIILAAAPTATAAYIMAQQLNSDAELTGTIIMMTTLSSIVTYTLIIYLLKLSGI